MQFERHAVRIHVYLNPASTPIQHSGSTAVVENSTADREVSGAKLCVTYHFKVKHGRKIYYRNFQPIFLISKVSILDETDEFSNERKKERSFFKKITQQSYADIAQGWSIRQEFERSLVCIRMPPNTWNFQLFCFLETKKLGQKV